jgi:hypothetical protein
MRVPAALQARRPEIVISGREHVRRFAPALGAKEKRGRAPTPETATARAASSEMRLQDVGERSSVDDDNPTSLYST